MWVNVNNLCVLPAMFTAHNDQQYRYHQQQTYAGYEKTSFQCTPRSPKRCTLKFHLYIIRFFFVFIFIVRKESSYHECDAESKNVRRTRTEWYRMCVADVLIPSLLSTTEPMLLLSSSSNSACLYLVIWNTIARFRSNHVSRNKKIYSFQPLFYIFWLIRNWGRFRNFRGVRNF